ncbi:MAG: signal recognition particle protein, partial [Muribaculaceae bacterium]|nr:signal recognition particle protein [Muribaculaceae bacterium]
VKILRDEMAALMGGDKAPMNLEGHPAVVLMSGLQGSGKTTFSGKLALQQKNRKRNPLLVACDVYRPAAIEQLKVVGEKIGVPVYTEEGNKNPVEIALHAVEYAKENKYDLVIVDTAGRLAVDEEMMAEIYALKEALSPQETLFVVDAMTGQDAVNTAKAFNDKIDYDGVVLTKLDGSARGGAALTIRSVVKKPIKLIGTGEKLEDLDEFNPMGMANRILGYGDLVGLADKVNAIYDEDEARKIQEKMAKNKFDFEDFLGQIHQIKKLGSLKQVASMIPGLGKAIRDIDFDETVDPFKAIEAMIGSMTPYERHNPDVFKRDVKRRKRIAVGSGHSEVEVNRFIKQFEETRKMMSSVSKMKNNPQKMMSQIRQAQNAMKHRRR